MELPTRLYRGGRPGRPLTQGSGSRGWQPPEPIVGRCLLRSGGWTTIIRRVIACADGGPEGTHPARSKETAAISNAQDEIDGLCNGGGRPGKSKEPCESQRGGKAAVIQPQLLSYSFSASHFDLHPIMGPVTPIHESVNPLIPAPTFRASLNRP